MEAIVVPILTGLIFVELVAQTWAVDDKRLIPSDPDIRGIWQRPEYIESRLVDAGHTTSVSCASVSFSLTLIFRPRHGLHAGLCFPLNTMTSM
jgi:hypothetical protein